MKTPSSHEIASLNAQIYAVILTIAFSSLIFVFAPQIDLATAELFYVPGTNKFWGKSSDLIRTLHFSVPLVAKLMAVYGIGFMFYYSFYRPNKEHFKRGLYFCVTYALVPGIWINSFLKDNWGRPRPVQTVLFGGEHPFSPAYMITGLTKQYGSFVSGHVALAMFVAAIGIFLDPKRERFWVGTGVAYAALMSFVRVSEGGHYLSDVLLGALMALLGVLLAKRLYLRKTRSF